MKGSKKGLAANGSSNDTFKGRKDDKKKNPLTLRESEKSKNTKIPESKDDIIKNKIRDKLTSLRLVENMHCFEFDGKALKTVKKLKNDVFEFRRLHVFVHLKEDKNKKKFIKNYYISYSDRCVIDNVSNLHGGTDMAIAKDIELKISANLELVASGEIVPSFQEITRFFYNPSLLAQLYPKTDKLKRKTFFKGKKVNNIEVNFKTVFAQHRDEKTMFSDKENTETGVETERGKKGIKDKVQENGTEGSRNTRNKKKLENIPYNSLPNNSKKNGNVDHLNNHDNETENTVDESNKESETSVYQLMLGNFDSFDSSLQLENEENLQIREKKKPSKWYKKGPKGR